MKYTVIMTFSVSGAQRCLDDGRTQSGQVWRREYDAGKVDVLTQRKSECFDFIILV